MHKIGSKSNCLLKPKEKTIGILNGPDKQSEINFDAKCENPEHELFLFSVLLERFELAQLFWHAGNNQLSSALVASKILKYYAGKVEVGQENYLKQAEDYEKLACDVLQICYDKDSKLVNNLLVNKVAVFGKISTLDIAVLANSIEFISQTTCQNLLNRQWYGQIETDTSYYKLYSCAIVPILAPILIEFESKKEIEREKQNQIEDDEENEEEDDADRFSLITDDPNVKNSTSDLIPLKPVKQSKLYLTIRNYFKLLFKFLRAPIVKLFYHQISYFLFLLLLSYVVMCEFTPVNYNRLPMSVYEIVLITWVCTLTLEEFRKFINNSAKIIKGKWLSYIFQNWNLVGIAAIVFYFSALVLRLIPNSSNCYTAARILMAIDVILWYIRTLSAYWHAKQLGPMLLLIQQIMIDLLYFILIILLVLFAFGVSTQSLLFPNQIASPNLLKNIFFPSFFVIFKEYYTRNDMMNAAACIPNQSLTSLNDFYNDDCPNEVGSDFSLVIYVFYVALIHLLLLCLLNAIFTNKFNKIQMNAKKIWKFERYTLIHEYHFKPVLPAPFIIFSHILIIFRLIFSFIIRNCFSENYDYLDSKTKRRLLQVVDDLDTENGNNFYALNKLENSAVSELIVRKKREKFEMTSYSNNLEMLNRKIDVLSVRFDKLESELIEAPKQQLVINYNKNLEANKSKKSRKNFENSSKSYASKYLQDINKLESSLTNPRADPDILAVNDFLRPQLNFNHYDERYKVDRTSCNGTYLVQNRIPICPVKSSNNGRGSLFYWGPNHALIVVISRQLNNSFQMLVKESPDWTSFKFPRIFKKDMRHVNRLSREDTDFLINKLFDDDQIDIDYKEHLISYLVDNSKLMGKYIPNSEMNTRNSWLEYAVISCFDKSNCLSETEKISLKSVHLIWKDLNNDLIRKIGLDDPFMASFLIRMLSENNQF